MKDHLMSIFAELANTKLTDVKPPVLVPVGHYTCMISGMWKEHKARSGNVAARFPFKVQAAGDDVDAEQLADAGGIPEKEYFLDFWMSPDALFRFKTFAEIQGINDELGITDALNEVATAGVPFVLEAKHEADQTDATKVYLRWDNPAPVA